MRKPKAGAGRDGGRFIALPHSVLESPAYLDLSYPARALPLEFALQFRGDDNGRLLCSRKHLAKRGWRSHDVIARAKQELLAAGFIYETVKGQRPNKASWYAVTWHVLDRLKGYDDGAAQLFQRGAYRKKILSPSGGTTVPSIGPPHGTEMRSPSPSHGTIKSSFTSLPSPPHGHPLEKPSVIVLDEDNGTVTATCKHMLNGKQALGFRLLANAANQFTYKHTPAFSA
ncbi:MAG: hypothetical protein ACOYBQ_08795 [Fluviibacter sp.]